MEGRCENLEEATDVSEFLITETRKVEERLFYSYAITDNLLSNFNVICYQVSTSVASEAIRCNNLESE